MSETNFNNTDAGQAENTPAQPNPATSPTSTAKTGEIGSKDYTDLKPLYASSYGNSCLFTARNNGRKVVIKALKADRATDPQCRAALHQEYDVTSLLDNKYVRKAIDFVQIQGLGDCIILEYVDGKSLAEHVRVGTLSEKQVKNILIEVCEALVYVHRNQQVHCNLKPENIMVASSDCRVKLIDFGIPETNPDADRELLIKEMEFVAPEIIKGEDFDARADIYSLGKIMEFIGDRNISREFSNVATHCTQFSKEQRYDSISEVKSAISKSHPLLKLLLFLVAAGLLAALALIYLPKIKANVEKERAERMAVDFAHESENVRGQLPALCEKYRLTSLDEPVAVNWATDSLRLAEALMPFFGHNDFKAKAKALLETQKAEIEKSRQNDFDKLLLAKFKAENDSLVSAQTGMTDEQLLMEARKWYGQMK